MSFKDFSSAHGATGKNGAGEKSKDAATAERPVAKPDTKAAAAVPASKP